MAERWMINCAVRGDGADTAMPAPVLLQKVAS
jgi:hypothetical protein